MNLTGKIDLFKNQGGYVMGVIKSFDENKKYTGKSFVNVVGVEVLKGETLTIDVKEGYLMNVHVKGKAPSKEFDKVVIVVKQYDVIKSFKPRPAEEKAEDKKEGSK